MRPSFPKAILGGLLGTTLITLMMYYVFPLMTREPMDIAGLLAPLVAGSWTGGMLMHFTIGILLVPLIYAAFAYRLLAGTPIVRGIYWGAGLWVLAQALVLPTLGAGFFSADIGGATAAVGSLVGHSLYGAVLGATAGGP